jgi:hypothetical protein
MLYLETMSFHSSFSLYASTSDEIVHQIFMSFGTGFLSKICWASMSVVKICSVTVILHLRV